MDNRGKKKRKRKRNSMNQHSIPRILYADLDLNTSPVDENGLRHGIATVNTELPLGLDAVIRFDARKDLQFERYNKNPVLLADHENSVHNVLGSVRTHSWGEAGLEVGMEFSPDTASQAVAQKWDAGYLKGLSIGFYPQPGEVESSIEEHDDLEYGLFVLTVGRSDLLELSVVAVPRDPDALKLSYSAAGFDIDSVRDRLLQSERTAGYTGLKNVLDGAFVYD